MKQAAILSTAVLSLTLGVGIPAYAQQEQHEQQEEQKAKPVQEKEKRAEPGKSVKQEEKNAQQQDQSKPAERNAQEQHSQPDKPGKQEEHARGNRRIPDDRFKANFGREHSFRVTESDYRNHRFQFGGYWFGFASSWPGNWLYTQDVYVIEIDGVYYLCNTSYPGVNLTLDVTL